MPKEYLATVAHKNSIANAMAGNTEKCLALFDTDAVVPDTTVGPSELDAIIPDKRLPCGNMVAAVVNDGGKLTSPNIYWDVGASGDRLPALGISW
jgi:hypothetical protein